MREEGFLNIIRQEYKARVASGMLSWLRQIISFHSNSVELLALEPPKNESVMAAVRHRLFLYSETKPSELKGSNFMLKTCRKPGIETSVLNNAHAKLKR